jgi:hypothetical protein
LKELDIKQVRKEKKMDMSVMTFNGNRNIAVLESQIGKITKTQRDKNPFVSVLQLIDLVHQTNLGVEVTPTMMKKIAPIDCQGGFKVERDINA